LNMSLSMKWNSTSTDIKRLFECSLDGEIVAGEFFYTLSIF
jgi:hypothetical protein